MRRSSGHIALASMSGKLGVLPSRIGVDAADGEGRGTGGGSSRVGGGAVLKGLGRSLLPVDCGYGIGGGDEDGGTGSLVGGSGRDDDGGGAPVVSVAVGQGTAAVAVGYTPTALASSPPLHSQHPSRPCS